MIERNLITNTRGNADAMPDPSKKIGVGVYLDWRAGNATIADNFIVNSSSEAGGVFVHGGHDVIVERNLISQSTWPALGFALLTNEGPALVEDMPGNIARGNLLYTQTSTRGVLRLVDSTYAQWNGRAPGLVSYRADNISMNPLSPAHVERDDRTTVTIGFCDNGSTCLTNGLRDFYETTSASTSLRSERVLTNPTDMQSTVTLAEPMCDELGARVDSPVTLQPRTARLLLRCYCNRDGTCNNNETTTVCPSDCR